MANGFPESNDKAGTLLHSFVQLRTTSYSKSLEAADTLATPGFGMPRVSAHITGRRWGHFSVSIARKMVTRLSVEVKITI